MKNLKIALIAFFGMLMSGCRQGDAVLEGLKARYKQLEREAEFVTINGAPVAQKIRFLQAEEQLLPDSLQLKQIALIRHGEPDLHKGGRFSYQEAREYMESYDTVGILLPDEPFFMVKEGEDILFYTSTLERARATAQYLFGPEREVVETEDFREFERRVDPRRLRIKLPLRYWTVAARVEWMLGLRGDGLESFGEAKKRAKQGAQKLDADSQRHDKIVLVAHGFLNRYIKAYLEDEGWEVVRDGGRGYFATTILATVEKVPENQMASSASVSKVDE
jgi:broad specificity phosphatase PhoE